MLLKNRIKLGGHFDVRCIGPDGKVKWTDRMDNLVVSAGLNKILDLTFKAEEALVTWYVGLLADGPTIAAADTLASHAGWTELTAYTGDRKEFVDARTNQSVTNSASKAAFAISSDSQTIAGAFLCSAASGTSGILLCGATFTGGDKSADNGDTLEVTYTFSAADDGA